jgi:hypothetical protein
VSIAIQAATILALYLLEPLRKSRMTAEFRDVRAETDAARRRMEDVRRKRAEERKEIELKPGDARILIEQAEEKAAREIQAQLEAMAVLLEEIEAIADQKFNELSATGADTSDKVWSPLPPPPGPDAGVADLHATSLALHDAIAERFAFARAADMAIEQNISADVAMAQIILPTPPARFQADAIVRDPRTVGERSACNEALEQAANDAVRFWQSAHNMGLAARALAGQPGGANAPGAPADGGEGQGGEGIGSPASRRSVAAQAALAKTGRFADLTPFMVHSGHSASGDPGSMDGGLDISGRGERSGYAEEGGEGVSQTWTPPLLPEDRVIREALPGRRFNRDSPRTGWLYLDTWYLIGPWDNAGQLGFQQTFPPETLVDLDAIYTGKHGQPLAWQFHQSDNIRIKSPREMEQAAYYGYTEVYFDEAADMLVAFASDDAAKVWLNGMVIWEDAGLSPWRLDEGFRRVLFRQGFNTVLFRVDNGPNICTFSFLLCPPEALGL